jgi:hypothetical protein
VSLSIVPFLNWLLRKPQGVNATRTTFDALITPTRASNLDKLVNITAGPVALQSVVGTHNDAAAVNTTLFALAQLMEQYLCDVEAKMRQIAAAQAQSATVTVNIVSEIMVTSSYTAATLWGNVPVNYSTNYGASGFPVDVYGAGSGSVVSTLGGGLGIGAGGTPQVGVSSYNVYSVQTPVQTLTPSTLQTSIPGITLPPLGGCSGTVAGAVQVLLVGYVPPASVAAMYPFSMGDTRPASGPYYGLHWNSATQQFEFVARNDANVVSTVAIPSTVALYPCTIYWSSSGGQLVAADGTSYSIDAAHMPATTDQLGGFFPQNTNGYLTYVNVSYV